MSSCLRTIASALHRIMTRVGKHSLYEPLQGANSRRGRSMGMWALVLLASLIMLAIWNMDLRGPLMSRLGVSSFRFSVKSQHTEPISIVFMAGHSEDSVGDVVEAILAHTVGPYDLIGVFTAQDDSETTTTSSIQSYLSSLPPSSRGLRRYRAISATENLSPAEARIVGIKTARHRHVAVVNANDRLTTFGWDRIMLTGLKSSEQLLGVSGRAAANLEHSGQISRLIDAVGEPFPENHTADISGPEVLIRHVALRSPMLYDARKIARLGYTGLEQEEKGLGDMDMCLRGRRDHSWACGYYPVSVETEDVWKTVPGTPSFGLEFELSSADVDGLRLSEHALGQDEYKVVKALPRRTADVPKTIVTSITDEHSAFFELYKTLDWSAHTRVIVYIDSTQITCVDDLRRLPGVELRYLPGVVHDARNQMSHRIQLLDQTAHEIGGLVLWVDSDRLLNSEISRIWSDLARHGVWAGKVLVGDQSSGGPSSQACDPGAIGVNTLHPRWAHGMWQAAWAETAREDGSIGHILGKVGYICAKSTLAISRPMSGTKSICG